MYTIVLTCKGGQYFKITTLMRYNRIEDLCVQINILPKKKQPKNIIISISRQDATSNLEYGSGGTQLRNQTHNVSRKTARDLVSKNLKSLGIKGPVIGNRLFLVHLLSRVFMLHKNIIPFTVLIFKKHVIAW